MLAERGRDVCAENAPGPFDPEAIYRIRASALGAREEFELPRGLLNIPATHPCKLSTWLTMEMGLYSNPRPAEAQPSTRRILDLGICDKERRGDRT